MMAAGVAGLLGSGEGRRRTRGSFGLRCDQLGMRLGGLGANDRGTSPQIAQLALDLGNGVGHRTWPL